MKRWRKILLVSLSVVLAIPLAICLIILIPAVQTRLCHTATDFVNEKIEGRIDIGSVRFIPFHTLSIGDVNITDKTGDTLLDANKLLVNINGFSLLSDTLVVNRIGLDRTSVKLVKDSLGKTNFENVLGNLLKKEKKDTTATEIPWGGFKLRRFTIHKLKFNFDNKYRIERLDLAIRNVVVGNGVYGTIGSLYLEEKSGFKVEDLSTVFMLNNESAVIKDFKYKDNFSDIDIPVIQMDYGKWENLSKFADSVQVLAVFDKARLGLGSAGIVVEKFRNNNLSVILDGTIQGKLSAIATRNLTVKTPSKGSCINLSAVIKGLPDVKSTTFKGNLKQSYVSIGDIRNILKAFSKKAVTFPEGVKDKQRINLNCVVGGTLDANEGSLNIDAGELGSISGNFRSGISTARIVGGELSVLNVDLGTLTGNKNLGKISTYFAGWAEMNPDSLRAEIITAEINKLDFKGYQYSDISCGGTINKNHYCGEISSLDTNLFFKLKGDLLLDKKGESKLEGTGNFSRIDLGALHLAPVDTCLTRFMIDFDMSEEGHNKYIGNIQIRDMLAQLGKDVFNIGHLALSSTDDGAQHFSFNIESSLLNLSYQGSEYIYNILADIAELTTSELSHIMKPFKADSLKRSGTFGELTLVTGDLKPVQALIPKDVYINEGTTVKVKMENHKRFNIGVTSDLLAFEDKFIKDLDLNVHNDNGPIDLSLTTDMLQAGDFTIDKDTITASIVKNTITAGICYNDRNKALGTGRINAILNFPDTLQSEQKLRAEFLPSQMNIDGSLINIKPSVITMFKDGSLKIDKFMVADTSSYLKIDGTLSKSRRDTLKLVVKDYDLNSLNFLMKKNLQLGGIINGQCVGTGLMGKEFSFIADFNSNAMELAGRKIGDVRILSKWDEKNQKINFLLGNTLGDKKPLNVYGNYLPDKKELSLKAEIDSLGIGWIDPFLVSVVDHSTGTLSGEVEVSGKMDNLKIASHGMRINQLHTTLSYTKVPYVLDGPFKIDETGVFIDKMTISDTKGSSGKIHGSYMFKGEDKGKLDLNFDLKSIHGLNTTFQDANQGFYGTANATGKVRVEGPMRGLKIHIDIATEEGEVHIPLDEAASVKKRDILTFVDRRNIAQSAYDSIIDLRRLGKGAKGRKTGVKCFVNLKVSPLTALNVDINRSTGDKAAVNGKGQVEIKTGEGQFDIRGNYIINEGYCHFSILGITAKDFIIKEGGSINFVGPVLQTEFKLSAAYQTKANIEALIGNSKSVGNRRMVNCTINLTGKIDNPEIKFKIEIPDLDPSYKNMVDSALSTDEKNLRQGLALLVSGGFIPDQQSGIVNNSTFLYSNASEIVSNQLSNIFHQLNIPVDLGFKYQPGSTGVNIFDVAVSTQLFNNRVSINGSIGNKEYSTGGSNTDIVGNIDVGIKINKTGQWKVNVFSHAADVYSNYLDQSQRNGAGVTYQEEFSTFRELWNKIFRRKRKQADR